MTNDLVLRVDAFRGPEQWRWVLCDERGGFLADHLVALDRTAPAYGGFVDLISWLDTFAARDDWRESARRLVTELGVWIGREVLGPIGPAILRAGTPAVVRVVIPEDASALLHRPFELGHVGGQPLALHDVSLILESGRPKGAAKQAAGDRLRILAVFSLPDTRAPLGLRRERYLLKQLVDEVRQTRRRAIDLVILQYGVTRDRLCDELEDGEGWDVVHISGHGLAGGLLLERADGGEDRLDTRAIVRMLGPAKARLKLAVLSTCDSASATIDETRRWLGLPEAENQSRERGSQGATPEPLSAVAQRIVHDLDCAVLAMRYPVNDEFAIDLGLSLYRRLLDRERPLPEALQMALRDVWDDGRRADIAPFAPATPALFGALAASLRLRAPLARPVIEPEAPGIAHLPREPAHFVGRAGPIARAASALAPASSLRAVLFHGMAGAGKTACAAELAHRYEHSGFEHFAWYKAPDEDGNIVEALQCFAHELEMQVPGLKLVHAMESEAMLSRALVQLTRALGQHAILIGLDNLESLLTSAGEFRDRRWDALVHALIGHDGFSRVIITSRVAPASFHRDPRVLVEPIHALSLGESLLLAREQANLGALLRGTAPVERARGRALVRRVLAVAQGHPQLLELAERQATDPEALCSRLVAFEEGAAEPPHLDALFAAGAGSARAEDLLETLRRWARRLVHELSHDARTLFYLLSNLEERDRNSAIVERVWTPLWSRCTMPTPTPPIDPAPLVQTGLIAARQVEDGHEFVIHPAIADVGRKEAGEAFAAAVNDELGSFWASLATLASKRGAAGATRHVAAAGRRGAPYLLRRRRWDLASSLLEHATICAPDPSSVCELLPHLRAIAIATRDEQRGPADAAVLANALVRAGRPAEAEPLLRDALRAAQASGDPRLATAVAGELVNVLRAATRTEAALEVLPQKIEATRRANLGPWSQLADACLRLQIMFDQRLYREVSAGVERLLAETVALSDRSDREEVVSPHSVREALLGIGHAVALQTEEWETALTLNREIQRSKHARDASAIEQARARFGDYRPMRALERLDDAEAALRWCKRVFEDGGDTQYLGKVFSALADLESARGHREQSALHEETALRYGYRSWRHEDVSVSHFNMANHLARLSVRSREALCHRLAAAIIDAQVASPKRETSLRGLAEHLASFAPSPPPVPASFDELAETVERVDGVQFRTIFARLPANFSTADEALTEVIARARAFVAA